MNVSGTGHRPDKLGGYGASPFNRIVWPIYLWLDEYKPKRAFSGMAIGFDQALAHAAILRGIPVTAAIPFAGQEAKWPLASRVAYKALLDKCDKIVIVSPGGYSAYKMQVRNEWMVDQLDSKDGDKLLSMWDGTDGGTKNCLDYAKAKYPDLEIVNLYDKWKELGTTNVKPLI